MGRPVLGSKVGLVHWAADRKMLGIIRNKPSTSDNLDRNFEAIVDYLAVAEPPVGLKDIGTMI